MRCLFHSIETDVIPRHFRGVWPSIIRMHPQFVRPCSPVRRLQSEIATKISFV
jgi:hypothetical protein